MSSARAILGLLVAGAVGVITESTAWAEVRATETAVAFSAWPHWPSAIDARGAPELSVHLTPPEPERPPPLAHQAPSDPEAAWLASLKLPDFPARIGPRVIEYLRFYRDTERGRAIAREWAHRSGRFVPAIRARLEQAKLPLDLVWLSLVESGHDPSIRSRAGALGLWQFMPATARLYGLEVDRWVDERHDPELSTLAAVRFLRDLRQRFGSWELAMAAYNMGPGGLSRSIQKYNTNDYWRLSRYEAGIPWETTLYVPKIIATALVMNNREAFGLDDVAVAEPEARDTVVLAPGRTLAEVAYVTGVPLPELLRQNPQLIARRAPPTQRGTSGWRLHLPPGKGAALSAHLAATTAAAPRDTVALGTSVDATGAADAGEPPGAAPETEPVVESTSEPGGAIEPVSAPAAQRVVVVPARRFQYTTRRTVFYEVADGDALAAIAARFRVTESELVLWNDLDRAARLQQGQVLQLFLPESQSLAGLRHMTPADVRLLVAGSPEFFAYFEGRAGRVRLVVAARRGDTLTRIGARYGLRAGVMERINQRSRREVLPVGEEVVVYAKPWRAAQVPGGVRVPVPLASAASSSEAATPPEAGPAVRTRAFSSERGR